MANRSGIASVMLRSSGHYNAIAFEAGLRQLGYEVRNAFPPRIEPCDVLVIWNRYAHLDGWAARYEAAGARVLVAENGYIGKRTVAIARNQHNGAGTWTTGAERWPSFGIACKPWRETGDHILVLPQRGVGPPGVAMPRTWRADVVGRLKKVTRRPIKVREHPGAEKPSLDPDLKNAWACVTWGSGAGIKAIVAGVPVFHELPNWIGAPAAIQGIADIEAPFLGDRAPMLERLAWAQWTHAEIESGAPFRQLLQCT